MVQQQEPCRISFHICYTNSSAIWSVDKEQNEVSLSIGDGIVKGLKIRQESILILSPHLLGELQFKAALRSASAHGTKYEELTDKHHLQLRGGLGNFEM
ncbi:unnamed protein product [Phytomonas sp. Hart1]|nr:unnamed protein product [Phytomonas sp. Hart1]|eukprot:CCW67830.1 unnamed protein product [Phytomonas sp. isolate Hart1]